MLETRRIPTFIQFLGYQGHDVQADLARERLKQQGGCVMRSLESALGARATEAEWDMRLEQVQAPVNGTVLQVIRKDFADVKNLIASLSTHNTPLGNAIRDLDHIEFAKLTVERIRDRIIAGDKTCIVQGKMEPEKPKALHMMHVNLKEGRFFSGSDNRYVDLSSEMHYPTVAFTPAPTPARTLIRA